jgi:hypothetical protein
MPVWSGWLGSPPVTIPAWIRSIATAAVGALLAYAAWSWLHSPYLYPAKVIHQDVVEVDEDETQRSVRLPIENIGTRAAENCEAVLQFRVPVDGNVIRSFHPIPWLPRRAELVVDDEEHGRRTTIPAGRNSTLELMRQYRNQNLQVYPHIGGDKFIRTNPEDAYHRPVNEEAEYAVLSPSGSTESDVIRSSGVFYADDVEDADWEEAVVQIVVETESARPLTIEFDAASDDDGWFEMKQRPLPWKRRAVSRLYQALNRIRNIGG